LARTPNLKSVTIGDKIPRIVGIKFPTLVERCSSKQDGMVSLTAEGRITDDERGDLGQAEPHYVRDGLWLGVGAGDKRHAVGQHRNLQARPP